METQNNGAEFIAELDKFKKDWRLQDEIEEQESSFLNEEKLRKMLKSNISETHSKLYKKYLFWVKCDFVVLLFLPLFCIISPYNPWLTGSVFSIIILASLIWSLITLKRLKSINISTLTTIEYSQRISIAKKYFIREQIIGSVVILTPFTLLLYGFNIERLIPCYIGGIIFCTLVTKSFLKLFKEISATLKELEELK